MGTFGNKFNEMDSLVLGCTHYPFVSDTLRQCVGPSVAFFEGGAPVARQTRRILTDAGTLVLASGPSAPPAVPTVAAHFCTSGNPEMLRSAVARWLGIQVEQPAQILV
jgi:glutamate racemase